MSVRILIGDAIERLRTLDAESVHCVVTSPPYWGLRDYGTASWEGGDGECDHGKPNRNAETTTMTGGTATLESRHFYRDACGKCGARRVDMQLGLESTPEEHCFAMVDVFREVWRVLRNDGTLWLNYGDCYNTNGQGKNAANFGKARCYPTYEKGQGRSRTSTLKPKDLVGMPWRVAFALQADGWYLRSDIIWAKPNPMPESVTDRPTKSHEYLFLMSKAGKYFYDADAVREDAEQTHIAERGNGVIRSNDLRTFGLTGPTGRTNPSCTHPAGRNLRDVWTIATHAYPGSHFATFPPSLVEPCIKAGCPEDGTALDPFGGAGTVGLVADRLGRNAILIELNEEYAAMARKRIYDDCPMFVNVELEGGNGL